MARLLGEALRVLALSIGRRRRDDLHHALDARAQLGDLPILVALLGARVLQPPRL